MNMIVSMSKKPKAVVLAASATDGVERCHPAQRAVGALVYPRVVSEEQDDEHKMESVKIF